MLEITRTKDGAYFFEKNSLSFGPCSGLCLMTPSQPAWYAFAR